MTETIAQASNAKMLIEKQRKKKREIIAKLILDTARTRMKVMMRKIMVMMMRITMMRKKAEKMKRDQETE